VATGTALLFRKTLLFFAFGAAPIHFAIAQIIRKEQTAARAFTGARSMDRRFAAGDWAFEDIFTVLAPIFAFKRLFAVGAFFGTHNFGSVGKKRSSTSGHHRPHIINNCLAIAKG